MKYLVKVFQIHKATIFDGMILLILLIIFFSRWIFLDRYLLFALDIVQDFSIHHFAAFSWSQGIVPLWDPYFFGPIVGYLNSGLFYPFNLLTDFLQILTYQNLNHSYLLMQVNLLFHFFLASLFMYLVVRRFVALRIIALTAGIIFAYSGYMVKGFMHPAYLQGATWLPLLFLFFYQSIFERKKWLKFSILTGVVFAISLLAGQTQPAIYFLFLLVVLSTYAAYHFWQTKEEKVIKPFLSLLVVILVTFGLFAIQFFPTWEYKKYTPRENIEYSYSIGYSADPFYFIIHSFVPSFWGTMQSRTWDGWNMETLDHDDQPKWLDRFWGGLPNEMVFYLGLLPFFLLPFAVFSKNKFLRNFLFILLFSSVLLMMARNIPLIGRLYWFILGGIARVPARAVVLWSFSLAFVAALGLQAILDLGKTKAEIFHKIIKVNFLIFSTLLFIFFPILLAVLLSQAGKPTMVFFLFPMLNGFSLFLVYFLIYSLLLFAFLKLQEKRLVLFFITVFTIIDVFSFNMGNTYIAAGNSPNTVLGYTKPEVGYLQLQQNQNKDFFRVHGLKLAAYANNLYSLGYGTAGLFGFAYRPAMELYSIALDNGSPIYSLLNVKYLYAENNKLDDFKSSVSSSNSLDGYPPYSAFDEDEKTEWVTDPKLKNNEKTWITANFRQPDVVARVEFLGRDNGLDEEIKDLEAVFSDGSVQKITLPVKTGWKTFDLKPTQTSFIKFIINDSDSNTQKNNAFGLREINIINVSGNKAEIGNSQFQKIAGLNLYLNKKIMPRVFTTHAYRKFNDRSEMFAAIQADKNGEEMRKTVFLYQKPLNFMNPAKLVQEESRAEITEYKLNRVTIKTDMIANGFLVLSDTWYPGWEVTIDDKKGKILSAYHLLRAVQLPTGKHTVIFRYNPRSFKIGFALTSFTIISLLVYFTLPLLVKKRSIKSP